MLVSPFLQLKSSNIQYFCTALPVHIRLFWLHSPVRYPCLKKAPQQDTTAQSDLTQTKAHMLCVFMDLHRSFKTAHVWYTCHLTYSDTHFLSCQHAPAPHFSPSHCCTIISTSAEHFAPSFQSHLSLTDTSLVPRSLGLVSRSLWSLNPIWLGGTSCQLNLHSPYPIFRIIQEIAKQCLRTNFHDLAYLHMSFKTTEPLLVDFSRQWHTRKSIFFGALDFCTEVTAEVGFTLWATASKNILHFHYANIIQDHLKIFRGLYKTQR